MPLRRGETNVPDDKMNFAQEAARAKEAFLATLAGLSTIEVTWAMNMLKEQTEERLKEAELDRLRHNAYDRKEKAVSCTQRIGFYRRILDLVSKWKEAEMHHSLPAIVEAVLN